MHPLIRQKNSSTNTKKYKANKYVQIIFLGEKKIQAIYIAATKNITLEKHYLELSINDKPTKKMKRKKKCYLRANITHKGFMKEFIMHLQKKMRIWDEMQRKKAHKTQLLSPTASKKKNCKAGEGKKI